MSSYLTEPGSSRRARRPHSWLSFTKEGVEDAKRCHPDVSLETYARDRGLTYRNSERWLHLLAIVPDYAARVHNVSTGLLGGRRVGMIAHELVGVGFSTSDDSRRIDMPGEFHGERLRDPWWWMPLASGNGPFAMSEAVAPATSVGLHVPEVSLLPPFTVISKHRSRAERTLAAHGLDGYRIHGQLKEEAEAAVFTAAVRDALRAVEGEYTAVQVVHGQMLITRDGYTTDPEALDAMVVQALVLADALAASQQPLLRDGPFTDPLPDAPVPVAPPKQSGLKLGPVTIGVGLPKQGPEVNDADGWGAGFVRAAEEFGLRTEDPDAFHRAFPRIPVPGRARGVLAGELPGGLTGRVHLHLPTTDRTLARTAVTFAAPPGSADTSPEGMAHDATAMQVAVVDGLVTCWNHEILRATIGTADTSRRAADAARAFGLA